MDKKTNGDYHHVPVLPEDRFHLNNRYRDQNYLVQVSAQGRSINTPNSSNNNNSKRNSDRADPNFGQNASNSRTPEHGSSNRNVRNNSRGKGPPIRIKDETSTDKYKKAQTIWRRRLEVSQPPSNVRLDGKENETNQTEAFNRLPLTKEPEELSRFNNSNRIDGKYVTRNASSSRNSNRGRRNFNFRGGNSRNNNVPRNNMGEDLHNFNDNDTDLSDAESTISRASTFSVPSYSRSSSSSRPRPLRSPPPPNQRGRNNWPERKPKMNEKPGNNRFDDKENESRGNDRNGSGSGNFNQNYKPNQGEEYNRLDRPNQRNDGNKFNRSDKNQKRNEGNGFHRFDKPNEHSDKKEPNHFDGPNQRNDRNDPNRFENHKRNNRNESRPLGRPNDRIDRNETRPPGRSNNRNDRNDPTHSQKPNDRNNGTGSGPPNRPNRRGDKNEKPNQGPYIGYKYLKSLSEKEPHEMICEILRENANIDSVLNRDQLQPDWIMLILEIIRKFCDSDFKSSRHQVLQYFCESPLLNHVYNFMGEVGMEKNPDTINNLNTFISNLVVFYSSVIKIIPTVALNKNLADFLLKTRQGIDLIRIYLQVEIDQTFVENLISLNQNLEDEANMHNKKVEKPKQDYVELVEDLPPPEDFRELSLYPTEEDLNRHNFGFVRPNKIKGAYENTDHYLDVQFRLIREDFIDPLRRGLRNYKDAISVHGKPRYKYESVRLYPNTRILNVEVTRDNQVAYKVNFNPNKKLKIKWEFCKRFMFGSLLVFSRDNFDTFFFATVFNRDLDKLKSGHILIKLTGDEELEPEVLKKTFTMAESEVFFDPYFLVMKALKDYNEDNFPMKKFIVDGDTRVDLPHYAIGLQDFYIYDYSVNLQYGLNFDWPHHSLIGFDQHQFRAFKTALTSNFTVIQGPPGTGKTYLGLKIVETLLNNVKFNENVFKTPILLVCYTNHALDQFLEGILKFTRKIVRVGGQSKSEILQPFNLRGKENLKALQKDARKLLAPIIRCRAEMRKILSQIKRKTEEKKMIEIPQGILPYCILSHIMTDEFKRTIHDEDTLLLWLLDTNFDSTAAPNNSKKNATEGDNEGSNESAENDDDEYYDAEDETMEADVLVNEDDVFDAPEVDPNDMTVRYCVSLQDYEILAEGTQQRLELLEQRKKDGLFNDYSEYHNFKHQLTDTLKGIQLEAEILDHYLEKAKQGLLAKLDNGYENLWDMPLDQRWSIYWNFVSQLRDSFAKEMKDLEANYRLWSQQYEELKQLEDYHIVKNSLVVGMTTTCAARLQTLLKALSPAIVIVEEAAEVLEAHIVVSLSKKCEQVILIGDHKQLKPSSAVYELSKKYNINVSLFERMINNGMYCPQLQIQHRMRPEISSLIVPSIYPDLKNHDSVLNYPSVRGITKNLFFVEHTVHEKNVDDSSSRKNEFEAEFMIQLCRYILLQGYAPEKITILTTYTGQMFLLREMKRENAILRDVKVIVVDKYQGEENDIILLSLVRSNQERRIGFLSIENRVCVALSRAKIGLYIIGNMDILSDSSLWKNIKDELTNQDAIGPKLTLYCDRHDVHTEVSCKADFNNVMEGGCNNFCHEIMDCGHNCQRLCHKVDMEHKEKKCFEKCLKRCVENHPCNKFCHEECGRCTELIERNLPCGHKATLPCYKDYQTHPCQVELNVILKPCSHQVVKKCHQSIEEVKCTFPCEDRLECGHQCVNNCHKTDDPDHLKYKCHKACEKINSGCSKDHKCEKLCFENCGKCRVRVDFTLKCGHKINLECSTDLDNVDCHHNPCGRKCLECRATCRKKCFEDCKPCKNKVTKIIPDCGHKIKIECSVVPERKLCKDKCQRFAPCGHKCKSICGKPCGIIPCTELVKSTRVGSLCGHGKANVPCHRRNEEIDAEELLQYCSEPCNKLLKCGDVCSGTCGSCWQGRLHKTCGEKCGNILVCGHSCSSPCRQVCPPCNNPCQYSCKHSKCPKKCGVPCVHCTEKCEWQCEHFKCTRNCGDICNRPPCNEPCPKKLPCEHDCIGFCGEPCPPKCRICDEEEVKMIFFGDEDEDDARFVLLEDCGHFIESKAMDKFIDMPAEKGEIVMKWCPLCKTPISKTLRYMNQVRKVYRDILNIKTKIYGNEKETREMRAEVLRKLKTLNCRYLHRKELLTIMKTSQAYFSKLENRGRQFHLSKQALRAMLFFTNMFLSINSRLEDLEACSENDKLRILKRLEFILKGVDSENRLINKQQVDEIEKELNRYHRMVDYRTYLLKPEYQNNRYSPEVMRITVIIVEILYGLKCFDNEQDARIGQLFEQLQKEVKSFQPLSQQEKRMIHQAMAKDFYGGVNSQGHWFTCTKGHYYCITECGGAMQESKCPECGEKIGGQNHRYVDTVRVASDMDGATGPAWSALNDMGNFNL